MAITVATTISVVVVVAAVVVIVVLGVTRPCLGGRASFWRNWPGVSFGVRGKEKGEDRAGMTCLRHEQSVVVSMQ